MKRERCVELEFGEGLVVWGGHARDEGVPFGVIGDAEDGGEYGGCWGGYAG